MFNILKSKPFLKDLIPDGFIDIHSHILPGIDDGARDINESLKLISDLKKLGFSKIIGTPHVYPGLYDNSKKSIVKSFNVLIKKNDTDINISYGCEYMIDFGLVLKAKKKSLITIKEKYVLIELGFMSAPIDYLDILFQIKISGYVPILAHPERYSYLSKNDFFKIRNIGCHFQANLFSLTNFYGLKTTNTLKMLYQNNLVDFVGSDIHNFNSMTEFSKKIKINNYDKIEGSIEKNNLFGV